MANSLLTPSMIIFETLRILEAACPMLETVNTDWQRYYAGNGPGAFKIGTTLTLRKPNRYLSQDGPGITVEDTTEPQVQLVIEKQKVIPLGFQDSDLTLTLDRYSDRYIKPSVSQLRTDIEVYLHQKAKNAIFNMVGPVTTPAVIASADDYAACIQRLDDYNVPEDERYGYLRPRDMRGLRSSAAALQSLFSPRLVEGVTEKPLTRLPFELDGSDVRATPAVANHTAGALGGAPVVDGNNQVGSTVNLKGWTPSIANILLQGDVLQFGALDTSAGAVLATNPQTRAALGFRACFVVTANVSSDAGGKTAVPIYPPINPMSGTTAQQQYATCQTSPLDGQTVIVNLGYAGGSITPQNIVMHKDCMTLAMVPMDVPPAGVIWAKQETYKGMTVRIIQFYDGMNDKRITRMDILFGAICQYPELGVRRPSALSG